MPLKSRRVKKKTTSGAKRTVKKPQTENKKKTSEPIDAPKEQPKKPKRDMDRLNTPEVKAKRKQSTIKSNIGRKLENQEMMLMIYEHSPTLYSLTDSAKQMGLHPDTIRKWMADSSFVERFEAAKYKKIDRIHQNLYLQATQTNDIAAIKLALDKLDKRAVDPFVSKVLHDLREKTINLRDAMYIIQEAGHPIPEVIKVEINASVMLAGMQAGERRTLSAEELEAKAQEVFASIEEQRSHWLPERQKDIEEVRASVKAEMGGRELPEEDGGDGR